MKSPGIHFSQFCQFGAILISVLCGAGAGAVPPGGVYFAERDPAGGVRLLFRGDEGAAPVPEALAVSEWRRFGLRSLTKRDPAASSAVVEIPGDLPRLVVRGDYQLIAYVNLAGTGSGFAAVGPWGVRILLSSAGERYRLESSGAVVSPGHDWIGLLWRGNANGEITLVDISGSEPQVLPVSLPVDSADLELEPRSLALTDRALFVAGLMPKEGRYLYRSALELSPGAPARAGRLEAVAGPFKELGPYLAGSAGGAAFLAGPDKDSLDVYSAAESGPAVNLTLNPAPYLPHTPEVPRIAVSASGDQVAYHVPYGSADVETFIHDASVPGLDGRRQVTTDDRFNPYIDQEGWLLFDRSGRLIFAAGHDVASTDVFSVSPTQGIEVINLTHTGGDMLPPFLVKGTLSIDNLMVLPGGSVLVSATGFLGGAVPGVIEISPVDGAGQIEQLGLSMAEGLYAAGTDFYFRAVKASGENGLFRLRGSEILEVATSPVGMPPVLLLATPEFAVAGIPGTGLFELRADAAPRLLAAAPAFAPAVAFIPDGNWLVFGRDAGGTYEYFLLDLSSGEERPLGGEPLSGEVLAVSGALPSAFRRGDANGDGDVDIADSVWTLIYLFLGTGALECPDAADTDDSGVLDITDPIFLLGHLFLSGPPIPPPHQVPGFDPTPDALGCR